MQPEAAAESRRRQVELASDVIASVWRVRVADLFPLRAACRNAPGRKTAVEFAPQAGVGAAAAASVEEERATGG